jgi:gliding motility-associated-like protein
LKQITLILIVLITNNLLAQKEANLWYFGSNAAVDFNLDPPVTLLNSQMKTFEGTASISDSEGKLLFYTDGVIVWNKNHDTMSNGFGLYGNRSSVHSALIIRKPNSKRYYYIFTSDEISVTLNDRGINYSIVDINGDKGNGEVISKNNLLLKGSSEKLVSTFHSNNKDLWVLAPQSGKDSLFIFLVNENGISKNVIRQNTKIPLNTNEKTSYRSQIKMSRNGKHLAFSTIEFNFSPYAAYLVRVYLFDFNNKTGAISNKKELFYINKDLSSPFIEAYGLEFSPNSEILYIALDDRGLYQCPIKKVKDNSLLDTTCLVVGKIQKKSLNSLQLAPNGKIYIAVPGNNLPVINFPDSLGLFCHFDSAGINLKSGHSSLGLPTIVYPNIYSSNLCFGDSTEVSLPLNSSDSVIWLFGDGQQQSTNATLVKHKYQDTGEYKVTAITYKYGKADTLNHNLRIYTIPILNLGNDTLICRGDSLTFNLQHPSIENYLWSFGDTLSTATLKTDGQYWVETSNYGCKERDTIAIKTLNNCFIDSKNYCFSDTTQFAITNNNADSILWQFGNGQQQVTANDSITFQYPDSGTFTIKARLYLNGLNRLITKAITITKTPKPFLGNDTLICETKNVQVNVISPKYDTYKWNDGTNTPIKALTKAGLYWMEVDINGCKESDSIEVKTFDCNIIVKNTCLGDSTEFLLNGNNADSIEFNFGDGVIQHTNHLKLKYRYDNEGSYSVTTRVFLGKEFLDISTPIEINPLPEVNLPNDTTICENQVLKTNLDLSLNLLWSDGSTQPNLKPLQSGRYILISEKMGCSTSDTVNIIIENCTCDLYFPNAFTPDNNNLNESFMPVTGCEVKDYELLIFNRWGQLIFTSKNINHGWDGNYKGKPAPNGAYLWMARYKAQFTGKTYNQKGSITLLR